VQNNPISIAANSIICKLNIYPWRESVTSERSRQQSLFSRSLSLLYFSFTGSSAAQQPGPQSARARESERALAFILVCGAQSHLFQPPNQPAIHPSVRVLQLQYRSAAACVVRSLSCNSLKYWHLSLTLFSHFWSPSHPDSLSRRDSVCARRHGLHGKGFKSCVDMFMHCYVKTGGLFGKLPGSSTDFLLLFSFLLVKYWRRFAKPLR